MIVDDRDIIRNSVYVPGGEAPKRESFINYININAEEKGKKDYIYSEEDSVDICAEFSVSVVIPCRRACS